MSDRSPGPACSTSPLHPPRPGQPDWHFPSSDSRYFFQHLPTCSPFTSLLLVASLAPTWPFLCLQSSFSETPINFQTSKTSHVIHLHKTLQGHLVLAQEVTSRLPGQAFKGLSRLAHSISPGLPGSTSSHVPSILTRAPEAPHMPCLYSPLPLRLRALCLWCPLLPCLSRRLAHPSKHGRVPCHAAISAVIILYWKDFFSIFLTPPLDHESLGGRSLLQSSLHSQCREQCLVVLCRSMEEWMNEQNISIDV